MEKNQSTFAVIETGGKQYKVAEGDIITIEKLDGEFNEGDTITFDKVLLTDKNGSTTVGAPYVGGATVTSELVFQGKGKKINGIRFRAKSRYTRRFGHRQHEMKVKIKSIA
ncbi:MAG: 50S ribosomal protein L21 [Candidatus Pacebacteria bacterium]|nr:50S ribosomal protein L21 [Candidatus Paceibacterota bacterium]MCD8507953.1 50S ribosomal protein L21 [Candidatus Paceibacterota bacterium]MCD8527980.1 50S ribosomal protein L21 [Candidatus Paceibacterota bacterium]MCD8563640.1 50S ribosomal protein L21 [Candidatus Paceibacterota bacterium]